MNNDISENFINRIKKKEVDRSLIKSIIDNHRIHSLYIIKYVVVYYPHISAECVINHIINSIECNECNIMEYILNIDTLKMCNNIFIKNIVCKNGCLCFSHNYLHEIYKRFLEILNATPNFFLQSINVYTSLVILLSKTDVLDDNMFIFINKISKNPKNWNLVIKFIKDVELFSTDYGDVIFNIRDVILENDRLDDTKKDRIITEFKNRNILVSMLHRYNAIQKSINKITNGVYISDISITKNISIMKEKKINCVVTLTKKQIFKINGIEYTQIHIDDVETVNFIDMTRDAIARTLEHIKTNKIILVHCYKGLSRSVCFVILLLIHQGMSFYAAYTLVKKKREYIDPNPTFIKQITEYYELNKKNT